MCGYFCNRFIEFILAGKTLTDFTNLFLPNKYKRNDNIILKCFMTSFQNMIEYNSHETHNIYPNLNDQQQFKLNKINEINDFVVVEIKER